MKKILLFAIFITVLSCDQKQQISNDGFIQDGYDPNEPQELVATKTVDQLPAKTSLPALTWLGMWANPTGGKLYKMTAQHFIDSVIVPNWSGEVTGGGGSTDTTSLSNRINLKANIASPTFTGTVVLPSTTSIGTITNTELSYVDGVTSAIQTQLNSKAASGANTDITSITGSAATLTTPRAINGTNFDGSAAITVTAAAGTLTGTTLNSSVVTSSLTSVGTIATGVWNGTDIAVADGGSGASTLTGALVGNGTSAFTGSNVSLTELNYVDGVTSAIQTQIDGKQATLVSATNIKTINSTSILGSGNLTVSAAPAGADQEMQFNDGGVLSSSPYLIFSGADQGMGNLNLYSGNINIYTGKFISNDGGSEAMLISNGTGQTGMTIRAGVSNYSSIYLESGSTNYSLIGHYGPSASGTMFGINMEDHLVINIDGTGNEGILMGTLTAKPVVLGTNNTARITIKSNGIINISYPVYADDTAAGVGGLVTNDIYQDASGNLKAKQ